MCSLISKGANLPQEPARVCNENNPMYCWQLSALWQIQVHRPESVLALLHCCSHCHMVAVGLEWQKEATSVRKIPGPLQC